MVTTFILEQLKRLAEMCPEVGVIYASNQTSTKNIHYIGLNVNIIEYFENEQLVEHTHELHRNVNNKYAKCDFKLDFYIQSFTDLKLKKGYELNHFHYQHKSLPKLKSNATDEEIELWGNANNYNNMSEKHKECCRNLELLLSTEEGKEQLKEYVDSLTIDSTEQTLSDHEELVKQNNQIDHRCYINWWMVLPECIYELEDDERSFIEDILKRFDEIEHNKHLYSPDNGIVLYDSMNSAATNLFAYSALHVINSDNCDGYYSYLWKNALLIKAGYMGAFDHKDTALFKGLEAFKLPKKANEEDRILWKLMMKYERFTADLAGCWNDSLLNKYLKLKNKITKKLYKLLLNNQPVSIYKQ